MSDTDNQKKGKIIAQIIKITKADPSKYFDKLDDKNVTYLEKQLKVLKGLK